MKTKLEKIDMSTNQLGNSDLSITPVGFGAWAIGGSGWEFGWGAQDDNESIAAIHSALDAGVNWTDTAALYVRRRRVAAIDLYKVNWPDPDDEIEEGWGTMAALQREGRVRHIGVSNFNVE